MTALRNGKEVSMVNRRSTRRRAQQPPAKPRRLTKSTKSTRKIQSTAEITEPPPTTRTRQTDLTALTRNIRYLQSVAANELATGDNDATLRQKRRWVQTEYEAGNLNGKVARELRDLYSKKNIGKIEKQRVMTQALSEAAKAAMQRLEDIFRQHAGATPVAGAGGDAARGEPSSNGENVHDTAGDAAADQATGEDVRPDAGSETEDETATEADDHDDPRDDYYDYDAVARQTALALGLELADHSAVNQGTGAGGYVGGGEGEAGPYMEGREGGVEAVVKMEEEDA